MSIYAVSLLITILVSFSSRSLADLPKQFGRVIVPAANLRGAPAPASPKNFGIDKLQESQLLFGEPLQVLSSKGQWLQVIALRQLKWLKSAGMQGYPGWVKKSLVRMSPNPVDPTHYTTAHETPVYSKPSKAAELAMRLSQGSFIKTKGKAIKASSGESFYSVDDPANRELYVETEKVSLLKSGVRKVSRKKLIQRAEEYLTQRYFWGGLTTEKLKIENHRTGVDCSGLVVNLFRSFGLHTLPRNADDQYRYSIKKGLKDLSTGDLLFLSKTPDASGISHVMLYEDQTRFLEASNRGQKRVRRATFMKSFNLRFTTLVANGGRLKDGRYLLAGRFPNIHWTP